MRATERTLATLIAKLSDDEEVAFRQRWEIPNWPTMEGAFDAARWLKSRGQVRAACRELAATVLPADGG